MLSPIKLCLRTAQSSYKKVAKEFYNVLSKFIIVCRTTFTAMLSHIQQPAACNLHDGFTISAYTVFLELDVFPHINTPAEICMIVHLHTQGSISAYSVHTYTCTYL